MLSGIADESQAAELQKLFAPAELLRDLTLVQAAKGAVGKNADARVAAELCLMQLCEPSLKLDAQSLGARVSKLEERLATGTFTPAKQQAKAESAENEEDDDRPPFPDDADGPLAGLPRRWMRGKRKSRRRRRQPMARRRSWTGAGRSWRRVSELSLIHI